MYTSIASFFLSVCSHVSGSAPRGFVCFQYFSFQFHLPDFDVHLILSVDPEFRSSVPLISLLYPGPVFPSIVDPLTHPASLDCGPIWMEYPIQPSILRQRFVQYFLNCLRWVLIAWHHMFRGIIIYVTYRAYEVCICPDCMHSNASQPHFHPPWLCDTIILVVLLNGS